MVKRSYQWSNRHFNYLPMYTGSVNLPPGKELYQCPAFNDGMAAYQNKGYKLHVNGGSQSQITGFGRENVGLLLEVGPIRDYGLGIGKTVDQWTDGTNGTTDDFTGFANNYVPVIGCAGLHSSMNEGYGVFAPYAINMANQPGIAYRIQKALGIASRAMGYDYMGEYSGVCYPLSPQLSGTFANSEAYRALVTNDTVSLNCLKGQPGPGQPNLVWQGDPYFQGDLHLYRSCCVQGYFEPGSSYMSAAQFMAATTTALVVTRNGLRALGNNTAKMWLYAWMCKAQENNTHFFHRNLPQPVGGEYYQGCFPSYDMTVMFDISLIGYLLASGVYAWGESDQTRGRNPTAVWPDEQNSDGVFVKRYSPSGSGNHAPTIATTAFSATLDGSPRAYTESPLCGEDMPKEAARCYRAMYDFTGSTTPVWFPVRKAGATAWVNRHPKASSTPFSRVVPSPWACRTAPLIMATSFLAVQALKRPTKCRCPAASTAPWQPPRRECSALF